MLSVERWEALKIVNEYEIVDVEEAQAFVAVYSECMDDKTVDEMIASYQKTLDLLIETEITEPVEKVQAQLDKLNKCKQLLGL